MLRNLIGTPVSLWYNKGMKTGELIVLNEMGTEEIVKINDWRSIHYLFAYCDKTIESKNYVKDVITPFLSHNGEDQKDQSKFHFGKRISNSRKFIFRVEEDGFLWHWMTTSWKPLTIDSVKGILPQTAWETTEVEPTDRHGGQVTYNMMFPDDSTAIVTIDAGILDGMHALSIKGKIFGELGEIQIDRKLKYRHTDVSKIGQGLIETLESMNKVHDALPNLINVVFNTDMLGEYKEKLGKELSGKLVNGMTVYHALAILKDTGKKIVAGTVLINSMKGSTVTTPVAITVASTVVVIPTPVVVLDPVIVPVVETPVEEAPQMTISELIEE
jgi:hypothetical protein